MHSASCIIFQIFLNKEKKKRERERGEGGGGNYVRLKS